MEQWRKDARTEVSIIDIEALVPKDHLPRKIEKVMDYDWLYERQFAYEAHTACDGHGFVLGVEVTAGNVHDSVAGNKV